VQWLRRLGVTYLRTGLSWADSLRPQALTWFDRQMQALAEFDVTLTFCFTPESRGVMPHYTSPPQRLEEFADFCVEMVRRYAPGTVLSPQRRRVDMLQPHGQEPAGVASRWPLPSDRPDVGALQVYRQEPGHGQSAP
jgi:beta-xylosidase